MSDDDNKAELERLRRENAALKKGASDRHHHHQVGRPLVDRYLALRALEKDVS